MKKERRDLTSYQLGAYVLERLGIHQGFMNMYHRRFAQSEMYQAHMKLLQYDMLYGHMFAFGGVTPYAGKPLEMGVNTISVRGVHQIGEDICIEGEGFTPWSVAFVDKKKKETLYVDNRTLLVKNTLLLEHGSVSVAQIASNNQILSQTPDWLYDNE